MSQHTPAPIPNHRLKAAREQRCWSQEEVAEHVETSAVNVSRWERGITHPTPHFRAKLCALFGKDAQALGFLPEQGPATKTPAPDARMWSVPYPRNPFFTGREEILQRLHALLHQQHATALTQSLALSGLGGIGKTQIALEYAYHHRNEYRFIFWTNAATQENLFADFTKIADLLRLPEKDDHDQRRVIGAVRTWLATHAEWLVILDNADDVALAREVMPPECPGHLVLTSRAQALGVLAQSLEVTDMGMAEGTRFLLRRAKLLTPGMPLNHVAEEHLAAAEAMVIELAFLPLALDQAGAYIDEVGCSLAAYLDLYRAHRQAMLQRRGHVPTDYPASVATTWSLSFQQVAQANAAAAEMLHLCAFLEPDAIPEEIFRAGSDALGPTIHDMAQDALLLNDAIEELRRFSLISRAPETQTLRIHRLVQAVLKDAMDAATQRQWAERAVLATYAVFPQSVEVETWPQALRYLPQAQACSLLIQDHAFAFPEASVLLARTAQYIGAQAMYEQAARLFLLALRIQEQALAPSHLDIVVTLNGLALIRRKQGQYEQTQTLYERALHLSEQALGLEHPQVASALNGLANFYRLQGNYAQAQQFYERALHIWKHAFGADHRSVATACNNLAVLAYEQGKYEEAESFFLQALDIRERILGPDHWDIALPLEGLANLYKTLGKYAQAEPLYLRGLQIEEQSLGPNHPEIALALNGLANFYLLQQNYAHAEALYLRAISIQEQTLGLSHFDLAMSLNNLGDLYQAMRKDEQAEPLYQRALHIWEHVAGEQHVAVSHPLHGLANLHRNQGNYEQAGICYRRALHIREHALGPQHPETAAILHDFAVLLQHCGRAQEAADLYQRALAIREQRLGAQHPKTLETATAHAALLRSLES